MDEHQTRLDFLIAFLAERDIPCPLCQYNLKGLKTDRCPECGSEVQVTVGLTEPRLAAFIAGVVGLACGLGFCVLILLWVGWMHLSRFGGPSLRQFWVLPVGALVMGVSLRAWLAFRKRIRTLPPCVQWISAATCFVLSLIVAISFFATAGP